MNPSLILDLMLTVLLSLTLVLGGAVTLFLLPWTDAEREGTVRAFTTLAGRIGAALQPPAPLRALPAR